MSQHPSAWGRVVGITALVGLVGVAMNASCRSQTPPPNPVTLIPVVCSMPAPRVREGAVANLRYDGWSRLLLKDYQSGFAAGNARDCMNQPVTWQDFPGRCEEYCDDPANEARAEEDRCKAPQSSAVPQRAISEDDVVVSRLTGALRLVWVITDRFTNGEAVGPVALVEFMPDRVAVRAIGTLRNYPKRVRLRLEEVNSRRVLVSEGEVCPDEEDATTCRRAARLMLLRGNRFYPDVLRSVSGRCIGSARFEYARETTRPLPGSPGWRRSFQLTTSMQVRGEGVQVHENVLVQDNDPSHPDIPPRVFRRAGEDRAIYVLNGHFYASDPSLWSRVLSVEARTSYIPDAGARRDGGRDAGDAGDGGEAERGDFISPDSGF
jgi:hypothetical protein